MPEFADQERDIVEVMEKIVDVSLDAPIGDDPSSGDAVSTLADVLGSEGNQEDELEKEERRNSSRTPFPPFRSAKRKSCGCSTGWTPWRTRRSRTSAKISFNRERPVKSRIKRSANCRKARKIRINFPTSWGIDARNPAQARKAAYFFLTLICGALAVILIYTAYEKFGPTELPWITFRSVLPRNQSR